MLERLWWRSLKARVGGRSSVQRGGLRDVRSRVKSKDYARRALPRPHRVIYTNLGGYIREENRFYVQGQYTLPVYGWRRRCARTNLTACGGHVTWTPTDLCMPAELGINSWNNSHTSEVQKLMCTVSTTLKPNEYTSKQDISQHLNAGI